MKRRNRLKQDIFVLLSYEWTPKDHWKAWVAIASDGKHPRSNPLDQVSYPLYLYLKE